MIAHEKVIFNDNMLYNFPERSNSYNETKGKINSQDLNTAGTIIASYSVLKNY